jgi:hypothetical protein
MVADYSTAQTIVERNEGGVHSGIGGRCGIFIMYVGREGEAAVEWSGVGWK